MNIAAILQCSNLCPDEKGTESFPDTLRVAVGAGVATYAPMKRGLKASRILSGWQLVLE